MGRAPCCDKSNVKRGPWSPEEDTKLKAYIDQNGTGGNWIALPQKIGLKRCGKSCRLRWLNYLRPNIKHGGFSEEEDNIICGLFLSIGSRWSIIASQLPGRTDNDIKNYWNTRLKKKLLGKQLKELQEARLNQEMSQREHPYLQLTENRTDIFFPTSQSTIRTNSDHTGINIMNNNNNRQQQQQTLYHPQMQQEVPNPNFPYQTITPVADDIQEFGIKIEDGIYLGGLIQNNQIPSDLTFSSEDFQLEDVMNNNNNKNSVMRSSANSPLQDRRNNYNKVQGYNGDFQVEPAAIETVFNNLIPNLGRLETDEFYGTSNSAEQSTISWDDLSSLVYHHPSQKL